MVGNSADVSGLDQGINKKQEDIAHKGVFSSKIKTALLVLGAALSIIGLYFLSQNNYLLFHSIVEVFPPVIAAAIFAIAWNAKRNMDNNYLLFIGIAFLFVASFGLLHMLAYRGMGVFPIVGANLATQLWIITRYMFSVSMLVALLFVRRKMPVNLVFIGYSLISALLIGSVFFWGIFPQAYVEGIGLTFFKIASEYAISGILVFAIVLLIRRRREFSRNFVKLVVAGMALGVASEMAFTLYTDVYGVANMVGHLFLVGSFYLIYKALVETALTKPYDLLFHSLKQSEENLQRHSTELTKVNELLTQEVADRKKAEYEANESAAKFELLSETTSALLTSKNPQAIVEGLCTSVMYYLKCDCFFNYLVDESNGKLRLNAYAGIPEEEARKIEWLPFGSSVCACVAQSGQRIVAEDVQNAVDIRTQMVKAFGIHAYACHPLVSQNQVVGTLSFGSKNRPSFSSDDLDLMKTVADHVAVAMQRIINEKTLQDYANRMEELANERASKLKDAERLAAIGATAGMVGHDIRNPLQAVVSELYLQRQEVASLPEGEAKRNLQEGIRSIETNLYYMDKIIADLQDFARPLVPMKQKLDIEKAIENALTIVNIPEDIKVIISFDKGLPQLDADPIMMRRIIVNLVQNAVQAMPKGGELTITASHNRKHIFVNVQDTGEGIPKEAQERLFTPLFTTKSKGQGFGLAVVKRLTDAQGGTITYQTQQAKGTKFTLQLPT